MARSIQQIRTKTLTVSNGQAGDFFDITNYSGACIAAFGTGVTGTMKLQRSNDGTNWKDITSATDTFASGFAIVDLAGVHAAFVRPVFDATAAGSVEIKYLAKDF